MHLYGVGFNEFEQLNRGPTNTTSNAIECINNETGTSRSETESGNHMHSTPIEIISNSLDDMMPSSIAISWNSILYRFDDGSLKFSPPDGRTCWTRTRSVALSWNRVYVVTQNGRCQCRQLCDASSTHTVTAGDDAQTDFVTVSAGNTHCVAVTESGIPWMIEVQPDLKKHPDTIPTEGSNADCGIDLSQAVSALHEGDSVSASCERLPLQAEERTVRLSRPLSQLLKVKAVSCGNEHVLLLSRIGVVYSLGVGSRGQLGHGDTENQSEPRMVDAIEAVTMVAIASGGWHSMALSDIGDVYVWGWNSSGQLGLPCQSISGAIQCPQTEPVAPSGDAVRATAAQTIVNLQTVPVLLEVAGEENVRAETEMTGEENVTAISCGSRHSAAVTDGGQLYTWGWNGYGQLGHSDTLSRDKPQRVEHFRKMGAHVTDVVAGYWNTLITTT